ncbi:hypothetical protein C8R48DRAFT_670780 [Suillus tomentosus]|nr:hypothetical protein C8R48DRAFT_670780 [Suillus tomentosus]
MHSNFNVPIAHRNKSPPLCSGVLDVLQSGHQHDLYLIPRATVYILSLPGVISVFGAGSDVAMVTNGVFADDFSIKLSVPILRSSSWTMQVVCAVISSFSLLVLAAECVLVNVTNRSIFINTAVILWAFRLSENPAAKIDMLTILDTATVHAPLFEICLEKRIDENVIRELCAPGK